MKLKGFLVGVSQSILLLSALNAWAEEDDDDELTGIFIQAGIGYNAFAANNDIDASANYDQRFPFGGITNTTQHVDSSVHEFKSSFTGNLGVGYLYGVNEWFNIGLQLGVSFLEDNTANNVSGGDSSYFAYIDHNPTWKYFSDNSSLEVQDEISRNVAEPTLDLLLGISPIENGMIFGLVGIAYNELTLDSTYNFNYQFKDNYEEEEFGEITGSAHGQDSNSNVYLRVGLGLLYEIYDDIAVNLTYIYTDYANLSTDGSADLTSCVTDECCEQCTTEGHLNASSDVGLEDHRVLFGVNYFYSF